MAFKLGKNKVFQAIAGEIKTKINFGSQAGDSDISVPGTPVIRVPLEDNVLGEANMDGSIYINDIVEPGSFEERQIINHEMKHATDIKIGRLTYADDHITYNGDRYERAYVNGKDMIMVEGKWIEAGSTDLPWESEANHKGNGNI